MDCRCASKTLPFFFGDHLILAGKTYEISVKTFLFYFFVIFFWRSPDFGRKNPARKKIWVNYSVFIWQGVNETRKVKNPCFRPYCSILFNFFSTVCNHKAHPPKRFLSLQIIAVVHHKLQNSNFWQEGSLNWVGGNLFAKCSKIVLKFFIHNKKLIQ